ncbi:hypothetical protein [Saccharothrix sp. HUAS TT1]|uniref:hypothetical protein n=1 Tax=unclassified Saccharothrix TaxID=2593673 RepID=UPI00345BF1A9
MTRPPDREVRADAPAAPSARVLALDIGVYGHRGSISSMFWYQAGGRLHTHVAELLPADATVLDQLDVLEALAESYPEYWQVSPVVVIGVTVLSPVGRREVRHHLDAWYNPPWRRRLVSVGDYAGEHTGIRGLMSRKKLRDLLAHRLTEHTITLTRAQHDAVALYTGRREKPGRDDDDEWRTDEADAYALPVALSCYAAGALLPPPLPGPQEQHRQLDRAARAWQLQLGVSETEALDHARRRGHPHQVAAAATSPTPDTPVIRRPEPGTPIRGQRGFRTPATDPDGSTRWG